LGPTFVPSGVAKRNGLILRLLKTLKSASAGRSCTCFHASAVIHGRSSARITRSNNLHINKRSEIN
jgi:hypothetical protein